MKRDRSLFATSALGLMLALPYPGISLAHDLPVAANTVSLAGAGPIVVAQNDENPDENRKKRRGHGEGQGGSHEGGGQARRPAQGHEGQAGRENQGQNQERRGGQGRHEGEGQHQPQRLNSAAPAENAPPAEKAPEMKPETGKERNKQRQYRLAPSPAKPQAEQPATPQEEQAPRQQRKHEREGGQSEGQGGKAQKPEYRLAPKQPAGQSGQAPSGERQAQPPSAPAQQERRHQGPKNGASEGQNPAEKPAMQNHQPSPQGMTQPPAKPTAPATGSQHQPAENAKPEQGNKPAPQELQGGNGRVQLPEQNGMQQQRPNFERQGRPQNGQANGGRLRNAAPVFDSQKRPFGERQGVRPGQQGPGQQGPGQQGNAPQSPNAPAQGAAQFGPAPRSDRAAQSDVRHGKIQSIDTIKGRRVDRDQLTPFQRPKGADVVKEIGSRVLIQMGTQVIVENRDRDQRIAHGARNVYYEDLPDDRTRETILRPDGSRVITIRDDYGDVIRRSRIMPDGRELVLVYVDNRDIDRDRDDGWRDPGADLPPMRLTVPEDDYILDASEIRDPDRYYEFLDQPPVERVPRLYTIGEVKRSARIRDMIPRIDLDTVNFDFGSAKIDESEVSKLQAVADAIERILKNNPAETFLIEGHTDAVGSQQSNLVLSDERAEAVATALTNVFGIPPENLTTQGYGEEFLKVDTDGPNRQNRRVTIRRITPLVAPVASNR